MSMLVHLRFKRTFQLFNFFSFLVIVLFECCETEYHDDVIKSKLRPLKYSSVNNCTEFCGKITCQTIKECKNGAILKNESYCNCCDACIEYLDIGHPCENLTKGSLALGSQSRCKPGTTCNIEGKCELDRNITSCLLALDIRSKLRGQKNYAEDIWIPQCDKEGNYTAKQKKIKKSLCFDKSGKTIFGSADDSLENTCACSRHMQEKEKREGIIYNAKPQEHCSPSGSFDTLQCINNLCYCADNNTGQVKSSLVRLDFLDMLPCYDSTNHKKNYLKNCEVELQRSRKLAYEFSQKRVKLMGIDRVKCDPDGSFAPSQCLSTECVCTDKEGAGIGSFKIGIQESMDIKMTCSCARDKISIPLPSQSTCLGHGSYANFTCSKDQCFCIDEDGDSISKVLIKSDQNITSVENIKLLCDELIQKITRPHEPKKDGDEDEGSGDDYDDYEWLI